MENFSLSSAAPSSSSAIVRPFLPHRSPINRARTLSFSVIRRPNKFLISALKDDGHSSNNKLSQSDLMELKFGQMLGDDPKLTLAKIMHRKVNPDVSYLEIEKNFYKNNGKIVEIKEVPFDVPKRGQVGTANKGLNLVRPMPDVPKRGQVGASSKGLKLVRPLGLAAGSGDDSGSSEIRKPGGSAGNKVRGGSKSNVPNVILRKPSMYGENDDNVDSSRIQIKPNLSLKMRTEPVKEKFEGMTLLKKPAPLSNSQDADEKHENVEESSANAVEQPGESLGAITMLKKPTPVASKKEDNSTGNASESYEVASAMETHLEGIPEIKDDSTSVQQILEMQPPERIDRVPSDFENGKKESPAIEFACSENRPGQPVRATSDPVIADASVSKASGNDDLEGKLPLNEAENADWARAEELFFSGERGVVELISCSTRGFAVSFGSLIGFLPYRNLAAKWKFLAFESWLRKKGLDPTNYRQKLGIIGNYGVTNSGAFLEPSPASESLQNTEIEVTADMELEELLRIYDQEKIKFLSSFVGQRMNVNILLADKKSRRLIVSLRPREKEEMVEKKRTLMRKLRVGDVVKCSIKKITYFGIFVEVEGVAALIHQSEVSWDTTLDPSSLYKVGLIVEAKVHQLDFTLERIFLSLKEITPDPMMETLEGVVGDNNSFNGRLQPSQMDTEWAEVDLLVKELLAVGGVQAVTKGRFFLSPGLAPTFQVYMASMFENQYKLLARSENKVQEVIVQSSMGKEEMKSVILTCTNNVE